MLSIDWFRRDAHSATTTVLSLAVIGSWATRPFDVILLKSSLKGQM